MTADGPADVPFQGASVRVRRHGPSPHRALIATDPPNVVEHYDALLEEMPREVGAVVFEPPGFGHSRLAPHLGYERDTQARLLGELVDALELAPVVLVLPCVSAYTGIELAGRRPELVDGLVLVQAPSWEQEQAWADRIDPGGVLQRPWLGPALMRIAPGWMARRWYKVAAGSQQTADRLIQTLEAADGLESGFPLASALQGLFGGSGEPRALADLPVLAVWGADDRTHRPSDPSSLRELVPQARVVTFGEAGHFPELEAPERFAQELEAFLDEVED